MTVEDGTDCLNRANLVRVTVTSLKSLALHFRGRGLCQEVSIGTNWVQDEEG